MRVSVAEDGPLVHWPGSSEPVGVISPCGPDSVSVVPSVPWVPFPDTHCDSVAAKGLCTGNVFDSTGAKPTATPSL